MIKVMVTVLFLAVAVVSLVSSRALAEAPVPPPEGRYVKCGEVHFVGRGANERVVFAVPRPTMMPSVWEITLVDHVPGRLENPNAKQVLRSLINENSGQPCLAGMLYHFPNSQLVMIPIKRAKFADELK